MEKELLELRKNGIGGSDVAGVMGLSRYSSPLRVYIDKTEPVVEQTDSEAAHWGNKLEAIVADEFCERTGKKVMRINRTLYHAQHDFILANIDRKIIGENALLECKTTNQYKASEWRDEEIPIEYILQCMHYLAVTGYEKAYIAVLIGGQKFAFKEIDRDEKIIESMIEKEINFWKNHVETRIPPMIDGSKASTEILKYLYAEAVGESTIQLGPEYDPIISLLTDKKIEAKKIEMEIDLLENKLKEQIKTNESAMTDKYIITWKNVTTRRFDAKTFEIRHKELYNEFLTSSTYRRFNIKEIK
jgi:putative phage-type endonuclease